MSHDYEHEHDHDHDHKHASPASPGDRTAALEAALKEKGVLPDGAIESVLEQVEHWSPRNGGHVVAKAWTDPAYRERLFNDATAACAELGYEGPQGEYMVAIENTPTLHNVVVCTQCSCTAWPVLGLPPDWYKSPEYRARVARQPRPVLRELGLELPESVKIRVWDTTAETRYFVLPLRPAGTEGWSEERLREIVTRESMIGVAVL
ncbi:MAG: nitrile hydratase [Hyphomicrobiaceae bacterium]|jgi:nitrile hydratase